MAVSTPPNTQPRESHIALPGCEMRYLEAGDGPALLHLHGSGGLRWDQQKATLAERFRVIAPRRRASAARHCPMACTVSQTWRARSPR